MAVSDSESETSALSTFSEEENVDTTTRSNAAAAVAAVVGDAEKKALAMTSTINRLLKSGSGGGGSVKESSSKSTSSSSSSVLLQSTAQSLESHIKTQKEAVTTRNLLKRHKLAQLNSQRIKKPAGLDAAHVKTRSGRNDDDEEEAVSASATVAVVAQYDAEYEMKLKKVSTRAVVKLFNAIRHAQKSVDSLNKEGGEISTCVQKHSAQVPVLSKTSFIKMLKSQTTTPSSSSVEVSASASSVKKSGENEEGNVAWARSDYMMQSAATTKATTTATSAAGGGGGGGGGGGVVSKKRYWDEDSD